MHTHTPSLGALLTLYCTTACVPQVLKERELGGFFGAPPAAAAPLEHPGWGWAPREDWGRTGPRAEQQATPTPETGSH